MSSSVLRSPQSPRDARIDLVSRQIVRRDEAHRRAERQPYARAGVSEYWFVDPEIDVVRVYRRDGERFARPVELTREAADTLATPLLPELTLPLERIFRE